MKVLCIEQQKNTLGVISDWVETRGYDSQVWRVYNQDEKRPDITDIDFVVAGGGSPRVVELEKYSFLNEEIKVLKEAIDADKLVFGMCLGAQLIGEALGAKGMRSEEREVGIFPIDLTKEGEDDPLLKGFGSSFPVFLFHNDMPGLTKDSVVLADSEGCSRQIVRYLPKVYGFQCHMEIGDFVFKNMSKVLSEAVGNGELLRYMQTPEVLMEHDGERQEINNKLFIILDRMVDLGCRL